jgi:farnesyl diphosphate synthase
MAQFNRSRSEVSEVMTSDSLSVAMVAVADRLESVIGSLVALPRGPEARLFEAMRYGTLNGGKRLRPFLVLSGARLFDVPDAHAYRVGAAVEMIHSYSLIHDDLPAMDDDDLRRGRPSCHIAFDEATAILAGDGLLTLAFEVLADPATHPDAEIRCALATALSRAAGAAGMVGGQMIDLEAENLDATPELITRLERLKTGALISVSCESGAILGDAGGDARAALREYGNDLGLAFQVTDDLLDVEGDEANLGKKVGKDAAAGKATFVSLLGVEGARREARMLVDRAVARLEGFGKEAEAFRQMGYFVLERRN